ncbi:hypothetical protein AUQ32_22675 [Escherichia coli]|nr:hypothetical protein PU65_25060 [Escherichia coli]KIO39615.1 hypothetical protein SU67_17235 [Escherichia coli O139:H28 str. E24377A]KRR51759.1 hypothetical protein EC2732_15407 [Escherichia coli VL2732]KIG74122.1 hypothetical protein PU41_01655 [Escherichia coli]KLH33090.1 hypothetical protein WQ69_19150 [Escherichia coli]
MIVAIELIVVLNVVLVIHIQVKSLVVRQMNQEYRQHMAQRRSILQILEQDGYMVGDHRCAILMLLDKAGNQLWDVPVHRMKM